MGVIQMVRREEETYDFINHWDFLPQIEILHGYRPCKRGIQLYAKIPYKSQAADSKKSIFAEYRKRNGKYCQDSGQQPGDLFIPGADVRILE